MNDKIEIVPAVPEDARGIQEMHYQTWLATYPNEELGITREDIEDRFKERMSEAGIAKRREQLANQPEDKITLVAKKDKKIVGWCGAAKYPDRNQLTAIYVLPEYHGKGVGFKLWEKAKEFLDFSKDTFVQVATYNARAIAFYKKLGFEDTSKRFTDERFKMKSGAVIPEMEMVIKAKKITTDSREKGENT